MSRSEELDQYFTKRSLAEELYRVTVAFLKELQIGFDCWLEPAAGDGAFFNLLPPESRMGIDIEKRLDEVIEHDFLTYPWENFDGKLWVAIGNPPFGKNSKLAIDFFNRCAMFCEAIAFIVPKTFCKDSVVNRLDDFFQIEYSQDLPDNSFEIDGQDKSVPCCFQIWVVQKERRQKIPIVKRHPDLEFLPTNRLNEATILFQRVGGGAGTFKEPGTGSGYSWKSNYYIKCSGGTAQVLRSIKEWPTKYWTAGNPSISKADLIEAYVEALKSQSS